MDETIDLMGLTDKLSAPDRTPPVALFRQATASGQRQLDLERSGLTQTPGELGKLYVGFEGEIKVSPPGADEEDVPSEAAFRFLAAGSQSVSPRLLRQDSS